jgi:hypothetical protein
MMTLADLFSFLPRNKRGLPSLIAMTGFIAVAAAVAKVFVS